MSWLLWVDWGDANWVDANWQSTSGATLMQAADSVLHGINKNHGCMGRSCSYELGKEAFSCRRQAEEEHKT